MAWELESILEQSLSQMEAGEETVESCLLSYPTMADQLEPLLTTAEKLRAMPKPDLSPEAKARLEDRLLAAAAANPLLRPAGRDRRPIVMPWWGWTLGALTTILMVAFLMMAVVVNASDNALPGSPFYPVKLAVEDAWLWVAPARAEPELHLRFARRRLAELEALAGQGRFDESVLQAMTAHVEAALDGVEELPAATALPVLDGLTVLLIDQQRTLSVLLDLAPAASRPAIEAALREGMAHLARAETLRALMQPLGPTLAPQVSDTPTPSATPTATAAPRLAPTEASTAVPTPEPTATLVPPPSPEPTATESPQPTKTRETPPGQTKTPEPPGQTKTPEPPGTP